MEQMLLTQRQEEILELVAKGCSNSDIGRMLGIATNTVKSHMAIILQRMNVANRTEATTLYRSHCAHKTESPALDLRHRPFITISVYQMTHSNEGPQEVFEQLVALLGNVELFDIVIGSPALFAQIDKSPKHDFHMHLKLCPQDSDRLSLSLFQTERDDNSVHLLTQLSLPNAVATISSMFSYVTMITQRILGSLAQSTPSNDLDRLCFCLAHYDSACSDRVTQTRTECEQLLSQHSDWSLPHAIKAIQTYHGLTRGSLHRSKKHIAALATHAQQALALDQQSSLAHLAFAQYSLICSELSLAKTHLLKSLELNPCQIAAAQLLGQVYAFEGNSDESISTFKRLLLWFPDNDTNGNGFGSLALAYYCSGDLQNSQQSALRALMYPNAPKAPLILTLISIAERTQDASALETYRQRLNEFQLSRTTLKDSVEVAAKIVPAALMQDYVASLKRAGLSI